MKIYAVLGSLNVGGAETVVERQLLSTDRNRFELTAAIRWREQEKKTFIEGQLADAGIRVVFFSRKPHALPILPECRVLQNIVRFSQIRLNKIIFGIQFSRLVLREKPDVIHLHLTVRYLPWFLYRFLQKRTGVRYCYTCHNPTNVLFGERRKRERRTAQYLIDKCGMELIALHEGMGRELSEMFHTDAVTVIHNGLDLDRFRTGRMDRAERSATLGIPPDAWVIGHVGRFTEAKNHRFLLDVFARVLEREPDAWLLLVGEGELLEEMKRRGTDPTFRGRITFHPVTPDVPRMMSAMDLFLLPSLFEGLPTVLLEAQASGLPCLASDVITPESRISTGCRFLSLDQPPEAWAETLLSMRGQTPQPLETLQEFDISTTTRRIEALYERLAEKDSGPAD